MSLLPWYIAGPLIGLMVPLILILREKQLGLSSSYRYLASFVLPKNSYLNYPKEQDLWQVHFGMGIILASFLLFQFDLVHTEPVDVTKEYVQTIPEIYSTTNWALFLVGGIFVGFGARYAGGCTAGHCIMGNALLTPASMISTVMFFLGGLLVSHFILPNIV